MSALSLMEISSSSAPQDVNLWIPPASGTVAAVLVAVTGAILAFNASGDKKAGFPHWLRSTVDAGPAWSLSDSWLTNIAGVGGILGAVTAANSSLGSLVTSGTATALTLLLLIFSGMAAFAPLTYVALATSPDATIDKAKASAWAFLSAAIVTMTAAMGELATLALFVCQVGNSATGKILLVAFIVIGAFLVAVYSVKTIKLYAGTQPGGAGTEGKPGGAGTAEGKPDAAQAAADQPAGQPAAAQLDAAQPAVDQPAGQPDAAQLDVDQPAVDQPAADQPAADQPRIPPAQPVLPSMFGYARSATL